jgi:uncharacterized membrane protein YfcA
LDIYLPIAGISQNIFILFPLGLVSGILSGLLGIGGGVVITPALILLGIPPTVAVATSANQMIGTSISGVYTHSRYGSIDMKLGWVIMIGSVAGGVGGVYLIHLVNRIGSADSMISFLYIVILGFVGSYMLVDGLPILKKRQGSGLPKRLQTRLLNLSLKMNFERTGLSVSVIPLILVGFLAGLLSSLMGVGGGFLIVPLLVYLLGLPMLLVTGTSLFQISLTSVFITFLQSVTNHNVDLILSSILLLGSSIGVVLGIKLAKKQEESNLKFLLAVIVLLVALLMAYHLWLPSGNASINTPSTGREESGVAVSWMTLLSLSHPGQYGMLSVLTALVLGLALSMFFKKGESLWNR